MVRSIFLLLISCGCALAEIAEPLSIERLAREAELVIHGEVRSKTVRRDHAGRIMTELEVAVHSSWKGNWREETIPVLHGGGVLGEQGVRILGQASYRVGEEVVLFLTPNGLGQFVTVGMAWGKFEVIHDESGSKVARQAGTGNSPAVPLHSIKDQVRGGFSND